MSTPGRPGGFPFDLNALDQLFGEFFQRAAPAPVASSPDIELVLVVTAALATEGGRQALTVQRRVRCPGCNVAGSYREAAQRPCATCQGTGKVEGTHGQLQLTGVCPECRGKARTGRACGKCADGFLMREERLRVQVPAETKAGQVLRLGGKGHERDDGGAGDLYVEILVEGASSGVGPLRVPLARAGELPARCFVCAGQREVTRVPVAVRRSSEAPKVDLPLCPHDHALVERRASSMAWIRWAAPLAAGGSVLLVFFALEARGTLVAVAAGAAVALALLAGVRWALARADARSPHHVWLDEGRSELVFPPIRAAQGAGVTHVEE